MTADSRSSLPSRVNRRALALFAVALGLVSAVALIGLVGSPALAAQPTPEPDAGVGQAGDGDAVPYLWLNLGPGVREAARGGMLAPQGPAAPLQTPDKDWKTNNMVTTVGDCTGTANQTDKGTHSDSSTGQLCQNYDDPTKSPIDLYESLDYSQPSQDPQGVDIAALNWACDEHFLYLEWETVDPPDLETSHDFLATIDIDADT
jgi:hypothetical protein